MSPEKNIKDAGERTLGVEHTPVTGISSDQPRLRILHLEDNPRDVELIKGMLERDGLIYDVTQVQSHDEFLAAITRGGWDMILSDYALPGFDGLSALAMARETSPEVPFILISGTVGEEVAVASLHQGATDYLLKQRLDRLPSAVRRAFHETKLRAEREQAEQRIREQAALLDKAQDAILVCDIEDRISYWNKGAERLYGWRFDEVIGQNAIPFIYSKDATPQLMEASAQLLGRGDWAGEQNQVTRDGSQITVESRLTLLRDRGGRPTAKLIINTEITARKKLEEQFLRAQRLASIGALASGIAHDLNNALAPVLMGARILRDELFTDESRKVLDSMEASAQRGAEIVKQILTFARGGEGKPQPVNLRHLLDDIANLSKATFPRSIRVVTKIDGDLSPVIGDATRLHQLFMNLCVNARDAMPNGGELRIEARNTRLDGKQTRTPSPPLSGYYVILTVTDTGIGIPAHLLDKIFEPFFTTKESGKGTGLGLATAMRLVHDQRGLLEVVSEPGAGTTFTVYLPAVEQPAPGLQEEKPAELLVGKGEVILLVEDESALLEITRTTLEACNYHVIPANNGAEAIVLYTQNQSRIDLVLTDAMMPIMDGPALIKEVRAINPRAKVICMTGLASQSKHSALASLNLDAILPKPYTGARLLNTLRQVLTRHSSDSARRL